MEKFHISDKEARRIHGISGTESDPDSDSEGREFDKLYHSMKPPPLDLESIKDKIVDFPPKKYPDRNDVPKDLKRNGYNDNERLILQHVEGNSVCAHKQGKPALEALKKLSLQTQNIYQTEGNADQDEKLKGIKIPGTGSLLHASNNSESTPSKLKKKKKKKKSKRSLEQTNENKTEAEKSSKGDHLSKNSSTSGDLGAGLVPDNTTKTYHTATDISHPDIVVYTGFSNLDDKVSSGHQSHNNSYVNNNPSEQHNSNSYCSGNPDTNVQFRYRDPSGKDVMIVVDYGELMKNDMATRSPDSSSRMNQTCHGESVSKKVLATSETRNITPLKGKKGKKKKWKPLIYDMKSDNTVEKISPRAADSEYDRLLRSLEDSYNSLNPHTQGRPNKKYSTSYFDEPNRIHYTYNSRSYQTKNTGNSVFAKEANFLAALDEQTLISETDVNVHKEEWKETENNETVDNRTSVVKNNTKKSEIQNQMDNGTEAESDQLTEKSAKRSKIETADNKSLAPHTDKVHEETETTNTCLQIGATQTEQPQVLHDASKYSSKYSYDAEALGKLSSQTQNSYPTENDNGQDGNLKNYFEIHRTELLLDVSNNSETETASTCLQIDEAQIEQPHIGPCTPKYSSKYSYDMEALKKLSPQTQNTYQIKNNVDQDEKSTNDFKIPNNSENTPSKVKKKKKKNKSKQSLEQTNKNKIEADKSLNGDHLSKNSSTNLHGNQESQAALVPDTPKYSSKYSYDMQALKKLSAQTQNTYETENNVDQGEKSTNDFKIPNNSENTPSKVKKNKSKQSLKQTNKNKIEADKSLKGDHLSENSSTSGDLGAGLVPDNTTKTCHTATDISHPDIVVYTGLSDIENKVSCSVNPDTNVQFHYTDPSGKNVLIMVDCADIIKNEVAMSAFNKSSSTSSTDSTPLIKKKRKKPKKKKPRQSTDDAQTKESTERPKTDTTLDVKSNNAVQEVSPSDRPLRGLENSNNGSCTQDTNQECFTSCLDEALRLRYADTTQGYETKNTDTSVFTTKPKTPQVDTKCAKVVTLDAEDTNEMTEIHGQNLIVHSKVSSSTSCDQNNYNNEFPTEGNFGSSDKDEPSIYEPLSTSGDKFNDCDNFANEDDNLKSKDVRRNTLCDNRLGKTETRNKNQERTGGIHLTVLILVRITFILVVAYLTIDVVRGVASFLKGNIFYICVALFSYIYMKIKS